MTLAAERLRDPANSIHTVATDIGYTSQFAFSAAFKRHFGVASGTFRWRQETTIAPSAPAPPR